MPFEAEEPEPDRHRLALHGRSHGKVGVLRLGQRKLWKELRLLHHIAKRLAVPLAAAADAH